MMNPFDDDQGRFLAVVNEEGQYSLWPAFADVPVGWEIAYGEGTRQACLEFIEHNWTDLRPKSLVAEMSQRSQITTEVSAS